MAIGWLTVLKLVPWGDVIENAPKVAQGAKKLWQTVGKKSVPGTVPASVPAAADQGALGGQEAKVAALAAQVAQLQVAAAELHQQMLESSSLIQELAEQNAQLIKRVDTNRKRLTMLAVLTLVLGLILAAKFF